MSRRFVQFHRLAMKEYLGAFDWYAARSHQAAHRFKIAFESASEKIADDALQFPAYRDEIRWLRLQRFPYILFFQAIDEKTVIVFAVAHAKRRPGYWLRRQRRP